MPDTDDSRSTKSGKSSSCLAPSTAPTSPETHRAGIEQQPPDNFLDMSSDGGSSTRGSAATSPHGSAAGSPARGAAIGSSARGSVGGSPLRGAAVTSPSRGAPVGSPLRGPPIVSPTGSSSFLDTYSTPDAWERRPQPGGSTDSPGAMPNTASPHGGGSQQGSQGGQATGLWLDTYDRRQQNRGPPQGATFGSPASNPSSRHSGFSEGWIPPTQRKHESHFSRRAWPPQPGCRPVIPGPWYSGCSAGRLEGWWIPIFRGCLPVRPQSPHPHGVGPYASYWH
ncbi:hypothetical protein BD413DRAFT_299679 [Trametes elegans]|nr:hypothetical protein BD413DRAFT_299679 [Trametes elegans]